ncbi:hypothetical protein GCM10010504_46760 [Streptomyces griseus]|nr:hypothetical protein GCM10010504_46760 [Streptomyces griseus]
MRAQDLPLAQPPVDGVHPGRAHGDTYPAGARVGLLGIDEAEDVGAAERGEAHFLHAADRNTNG